MVDVVGHFGMALLWLAPVWYFVDHRQTAALIVATGFWFGMLPDVDLPLSNWGLGLHHHGVVHTVLAVTIFAAVLGPRRTRLQTDRRPNGLVLRASAREGPPDRLSHRLDPRSRAPLRRHALGPRRLDADRTPLAPREGPGRHDGRTLVPVLVGDVGLLILGISVNALAWYWTDGRDESVDGAAVLTE